MNPYSIKEHLIDAENLHIFYFTFQNKSSRGIKNKICYVKFKTLGDETRIRRSNFLWSEHIL